MKGRWEEREGGDEKEGEGREGEGSKGEGRKGKREGKSFQNLVLGILKKKSLIQNIVVM